jgi:UDP-glucose 4-epimerase
LYLYREHYGIDYVALRYPNVYGPRQDPYGEAGVVAIFTQQMLEGKQPVINGNGKQERDYVYVADVARSNVLALQRDGGDIFNIGGGIGTSVNQIFDSLSRLTGYSGEQVHGPAKEGEVYRIFLDASRARSALGWQPQISLEDGLARTVDFFTNRPTR